MVQKPLPLPVEGSHVRYKPFCTQTCTTTSPAACVFRFNVPFFPMFKSLLLIQSFNLVLRWWPGDPAGVYRARLPAVHVVPSGGGCPCGQTAAPRHSLTRRPSLPPATLLPLPEIRLATCTGLFLSPRRLVSLLCHGSVCLQHHLLEATLVAYGGRGRMGRVKADPRRQKRRDQRPAMSHIHR